MAYTGVTVNDERAKELFAEGGRTSEAVLQQAVPVVSNGELQHRLQGPADTGCAGVPHEQVATIDGDEVSEDEGELDVNAALPDEEFSQEALPTMHFTARIYLGAIWTSSKPSGKSMPSSKNYGRWLWMN